MNDAEYVRFMKEQHVDEFTIDGALDKSKWANSPVRILFYLKENYGYQGQGVIRIEDYAPTWLADRNKTYVQMATLTAALNQAFKTVQVPDESEIAAMSKDPSQLAAVLGHLAVVNIKKTSGQSKSNDSEIRETSYKNAPMLRKQIDALAPNIIVAGGKVCWQSLVYDLDIYKEGHDLPPNSAIKRNGAVLCHTYHPAARGGEFDIPRIALAILDQAT